MLLFSDFAGWESIPHNKKIDVARKKQTIRLIAKPVRYAKPLTVNRRLDFFWWQSMVGPKKINTAASNESNKV